MRFLIFNIVVVAALAFLVMDRPSVEIARARPGELTIPKSPITETPVALQPQQHAPIQPEPALEVATPKPVAEVPPLPPLPPAQEVPVRVTHKPARDVPRDVSADLNARAERLKAEIIERQTASVQEQPMQTAAAPTPSYDKAVSRRKALMDLASDMENMFVEKMMR